MIANIFKRLPALAAASVITVLAGQAWAAGQEVNIAYQTVVEPAKVAQAT